MADDKRDGSDDLFEDLDKFFAPIQDVDWPEPDEPASAPASPPPPAEEHVAVHVEPPAPAAPAEQEEEPAEEPVVVATEDDAAWYDTGVLETVDAADDEDVAAGVVPDDTSVSPAMAEAMAEEPSPADLEAAAAHFASSLQNELQLDEPEDDTPEPVTMPFEDEPIDEGIVAVTPA
jgi:hypothetical protein